MISTNGNTINVFSLMNDFIDVTFEIEGGEEKFNKAYKILENAVEDWFDEDNEDAIDTCYGDYFQHILDKEGIDYTVTYNNRKSEDNDNLMKVTIFQKKNRDLGLHTIESAEIEALHCFRDYEKVYEGDIVCELQEKDERFCIEEFAYYAEPETVFSIFQHDISETIPKDYKGRSISPGDIIGIRYEFELNTRYYYCMGNGFYWYNNEFKTRHLGL